MSDSQFHKRDQKHERKKSKESKTREDKSKHRFSLSPFTTLRVKVKEERMDVLRRKEEEEEKTKEEEMRKEKEEEEEGEEREDSRDSAFYSLPDTSFTSLHLQHLPCTSLPLSPELRGAEECHLTTPPPPPLPSPTYTSTPGLPRPLYLEVSSPPAAPLVGRRWLWQKVEELLEGGEGGGVLLTGPPGAGKTAAVLSLVEASCFGEGVVEGREQEALAGQLVGYHFCQVDPQPHILLFRSLAPLLSCSLPSCSLGKSADPGAQADNAPTCRVPELVHSLAAQVAQAPQLHAYYNLLKVSFTSLTSSRNQRLQRFLLMPSCE